jgi:GNAT superfamily N-acetyltransferase
MRTAIRVETDLPAGIARLVDRSRAEGFRFVERLAREWSRGENRFAEAGEIFLGSYLDDSLVGFGGLNRDPYSGDPTEGRIRHVYFEPKARGLGLGGALVRELIQRARPAFVRLRLATQQAAPFYEHLGFQAVSEPNATHVLDLGRAEASPCRLGMRCW